MNEKKMAKQLEIATGIIEKMKKAGGIEALKTFIETEGKEFPPMKLSGAEMEVLKGGEGIIILVDGGKILNKPLYTW